MNTTDTIALSLLTLATFVLAWPLVKDLGLRWCLSALAFLVCVSAWFVLLLHLASPK